MKTTKQEVIASILVYKYREDKPDASYLNCVADTGESTVFWNNYNFFISEYKSNRFSKKNKFYISSIDPVESDIPDFSTGVYLNKGQLRFRDRTGIFKVSFSDNTFLYIAKWFSGAGRARTIDSMFCTEKPIWINFLKMVKGAYKRKSKPKLGVYRASLDKLAGITYEKIKNIPNNTIFHTELPRIKDSINYYFSHVPDFMKYNQSGRRTLLLYGEPGTSKTSTLYQLALEHKNTKSVVFTTDIGSLAIHIKQCEKYSIPTIVCFEDCESVMQYNNSKVKSFLSGIDAGRNKGGTCIVFTTNYPQQIEASIKERPERIDELHYIGPISGELLVLCAEFYFSSFLTPALNLKNVLVKPMTGAEVKLLVDNTLRYCASFGKELNEQSLRSVLSNFREDIVKLQKFSKGKMKKTFTQDVDQPTPVGFAMHSASQSEESEW